MLDESTTRPTQVTVTTSDAYVSTLDNIHDPEFRKELYKRYNHRNMLQLTDELGQMQPLEQTNFTHFEEDHVYEYIKIASNVGSPGTGNPITITLAASDHDSTGKLSYPQVNELVMFKNEVKGFIYSKSVAVDGAHTITIQPLKATDNIGAVSANDCLIIYSNAWAEGTNQPLSRAGGFIELSFVAQIIKRSYKVTGTETTNKIRFTVTNPQTGETSNKYYIKGESDMYMRYELDQEGAILLGETTTNTTLLANGIRTTGGLIDFIKNQGGIHHHTGGSGLWSLPQLDSLIDKLDKNLASKENTCWFGLKLRQETDNFINNAMQNGAITYAAFNGQKEVAISFGFSSIHRTGYTFHLKTYDVFNHPKFLGAPGFNFSNNGLIIPDESVWVTDAAGNKKMQKPLVIRYKAKDKIKRDMEHWITGGGSGVEHKTSDEDAMYMHYRSEKAFECAAPSKFAYISQ